VAQSDPAQQPEDTPASAPDPGQAATPSPRPALVRGVPFGWLLPIVLAAVLGVLVGFGLVVRGESLGATGPGSAASRPTFVIGAAVSPVSGGSPSPVSRASAVPADYVVQPGDTLRSIAQDAYGDAAQWPRIYDANRDVIGNNPDALYAGMRLRIP
jgi:nucleoid-associated protein YgaU